MGATSFGVCVGLQGLRRLDRLDDKDAARGSAHQRVGGYVERRHRQPVPRSAGRSQV
jgi:hypothetical protein